MKASVLPLISQTVQFEQDVVTARQRARLVAEQVGFELQDQTRIATSVSEIVRNAFRYTGSAKITFGIDEKESPQRMVVVIEDQGHGIEDLDTVLSGKYRSTTGMGLGILGTKRLMDTFDIETSRQGTKVTFSKTLSRRSRRLSIDDLRQISTRIAAERSDNPLEEVQRQNQELLRTLDELKLRQEELSLLNRELEDTNRGVVALYADLDEKADHLRRADEIKSKFLSNMSHEFRTPLNSILALSRILLERTDGELSSEQEIQINFIRKAALDLSELVNDLLDLAKVEAGKIEVRPSFFEVENLFGALRGMLKPLLLNESVHLIFEDAAEIPTMFSDEGKISQILRNLISNSLKFTERGEVRVRAQLSSEGTEIVFQVIDTGIGVPPQHIEAIFQEFTQIETAQHGKMKGTGLGLPLSRKLAELLGGELTAQSRLGEGSVFTATVPLTFPTIATPPSEQKELPEQGDDRASIAVVVLDDLPEEQHIFARILKETGYTIYPATTVTQARAEIERVTPAAVILDVRLDGEESWALMKELGSNMSNNRPVLIVTTVAQDRGRALALGADAFLTKPLDATALVTTLHSLIVKRRNPVALLIDDEEISRYLLRQMLSEIQFRSIEAHSGPIGIQTAIAERPAVIFLDVVMPEMDGFSVLEQLRSHPVTRNIPVIVNTSLRLGSTERERIESRGAVILSKDVATHDEAIHALEEALHQSGVQR